MRKFIINGIGLENDEIYGVHRYAIELIKELDSIVQPGQVEVVIPVYEDGTERLSLDNVKVVRLKVSAQKFSGFIWNQFIFLSYVKKSGGVSVDLTLSLPIRGCDIVCIHDCIRELFPEEASSFLGKISRRYYMLRVKRNITKAGCILTVSDYSKYDICKLYPQSRGKNITVIPNAWQHFQFIVPDTSILERLNMQKEDYFFALGSRSFHKNFAWIAAAAKQNRQYEFVISGTNVLSDSDLFINNEYISNLHFVGYLTDSEVKALMMHCKAFIQPSLYEGFGIPPMEAMSVGAKCVISNASCLPEIYGESVWYIDPLQYDNISMDDIMSGSIDDNSKILEKYSWRESAKLLYSVFTNYSDTCSTNI